ncbi:hypothetical protein BGZ97_012053 [Linnemannia gamsii]|uniref:RRM domain-containing protein n=1 Tax=Linnemannia gamsii TaxID=64522 RepID=A0A9P6R234_9FUNG|nr:hypothetical protein BGZ97_012053 [Linnemannia gamsii]
MDHLYTGHQQDDSEDLLMRTDNDIIDDVAEEAHHRRSSYHEERRKSDVGRDFDHKPALSRERSDERHHSRHDSEPHPNRGHDRDDKYDVRPTLNSYGSSGDAAGRRSRSRSPARETTGGNSVRERRVYVGNLSYDVKWTNLKDFMREIGPVAHADVLLGRDGRSKGCGVVEYQNADDARAAIRKLNDVVLMGRPVFVREDRESESRIGFSGGRGGAGAGTGAGAGAASARRDVNTRQIYVANLPYSINWKDLKDLFRKAGPVDRADIFQDREGRSRGTGTVSFDSSHDVGRAISMFNGYDWHGRRIEVREDKFGPPAGGQRPAQPSSSSRYEPSRDHGRGGDSYGYSSSSQRGYRDEGSRRDHHGHDMYDGAGITSHSSMASIPSGPAAGSGDQIYVRNLPLTTTSQDLKDLFRTCGPIRMAEMLESGGRSKGAGIVRFDLFESADKAVAKFNGYVYGGRPLEIVYDRV